jgi:hypothetical protein
MTKKRTLSVICLKCGQPFQIRASGTLPLHPSPDIVHMSVQCDGSFTRSFKERQKREGGNA